MNDEPKLRHQGDWEKIKHIEQIIEAEWNNESMALWAAEAIFQYVNENPLVSVHYIRREKAEAWDKGFESGWDRGHYETEADTNPYRGRE